MKQRKKESKVDSPAISKNSLRGDSASLDRTIPSSDTEVKNSISEDYAYDIGIDGARYSIVKDPDLIKQLEDDDHRNRKCSQEVKTHSILRMSSLCPERYLLFLPHPYDKSCHNAL